MKLSLNLNNKNSECNWNPQKHEGKPCPTHTGFDSDGWEDSKQSNFKK